MATADSILRLLVPAVRQFSLAVFQFFHRVVDPLSIYLACVPAIAIPGSGTVWLLGAPLAPAKFSWVGRDNASMEGRIRDIRDMVFLLSIR